MRVAHTQQYLPLEVGNRWDFTASNFNWLTHTGGSDTIMLRIAGFVRQANGKEYYELEQRGIHGYTFPLCPSRFIRADSMRMYVYFEEDSTEEVYFHFDAQQDVSWPLTHGWPSTIQLQSIDSTEMFQLPTRTLTFRRDGIMLDWITIFERFGPLASHFEGEPPGTCQEDITLSGCMLSGTTYGALLVDVEQLKNPSAADMLFPAYPNPFNPTTTIQYTLNVPQRVTLVVTDLYGREVRKLLDGNVQEAGSHQVQFDATGLPSGVYFYSLIADGQRLTKKMVVLR